MGLLSLTYRRPSYVSFEQFRRNQYSEKDDESLSSSKSGVSAGIPDGVSFDNIISGKTCPPVTLRDFMNYLRYVEHSSENLQFYLWYKGYIQRFQNLPASERAIAPEWTLKMSAAVAVKIQKEITMETTPPAVMERKMSHTPSLDQRGHTSIDPFGTPPGTAGNHEGSEYAPSIQPSSVFTHRSQANEVFAAAGIPLPFTIQPYREEIDRVLATYILDGAPRQLNLSDRDRKSLLHALAYTTHPSALHKVFCAIETSLRRQAHPNFIRWSVCNGNPERVSFARTLGIGGIVGGFIMAILLTLSNISRGWRAMGALACGIGVCTLVASYSGMCICMYSMNHHRHIRPWELFVDVEEPTEMQKQSFDSFSTSCSYEDEPWLEKHAKKSLLRKIFDAETRIQEPIVRTIQDTIFVQAMLFGLLSAGTFAALFIPLPSGHFF